MRSQHHNLCMWFRPNLASPGAVTSDVNNIVFLCGLDQKLCFTGSSYMRRKHHRLCMWFRPNHTSPAAATSNVNIIVFVIETKHPITGISYIRPKHHRLCMWFRPNQPHCEQLHEEKNIIVFVCGLDQTSLHRELLHQTSTISSLHVV